MKVVRHESRKSSFTLSSNVSSEKRNSIEALVFPVKNSKFQKKLQNRKFLLPQKKNNLVLAQAKRRNSAQNGPVLNSIFNNNQPDKVKQNNIFEPKKRYSVELKPSCSFEGMQKVQKNPYFDKMLQQKQILMYDGGLRCSCSTQCLKHVLNEAYNSLQFQKNVNTILQRENQNYDRYFKQLRPQDLQKKETVGRDNSQMKIFKYERKIQLLSYIIRQFRENNKEEAHRYEQMIRNYNPSLEQELTFKLAEANHANFLLKEKVNFFQTQFLSAEHPFELITASIMQDRRTISALTHANQQHSVDIEQQNTHIKHLQEIKQKYIVCNASNEEYVVEVSALKESNHRLQKEINALGQRYERLGVDYTKLIAQVQSLQSLQEQVEEKEEIIKQNAQVIDRLNKQNLELQKKLNSVMENFQQRLFGEKALKDRIISINDQIVGWKKKQLQSLSNMEKYNKEQTKFVEHLNEKIRGAYEEIFKEYRNQLSVTSDECKEWKQAFEDYNRNEQTRRKYIKDITLELILLDKKKKKCIELYQLLEFNYGCDSCQKFGARWGMLCQIYEQLRNNVERITLIFVTNE